MSASPLRAYIGVQQPIDREMARILLDASKEAEKIVASTIGSGVGAGVTAAQMKVASSELRKMSAEMWGGAITPTMKKGMEAAAVAAVQGETFIQDVLAKSFGSKLPALEAAVAFNAQNSVDNLLAKAENGISLSDKVYKAKALSDGWVDREIKRGLALQMSAKQISDRVRRFISPSTAGGVSYAANRLARTEINNAFHRAQINRAENDPWTTGMKWHLSGSHPKPDECNEYAEQVHEKGMEAGVFLPENVPGKPHPNCLCYLTSVSVSEEEFMQSFLKGKYSRHIDSTIYKSGIGTTC